MRECVKRVSERVNDRLGVFWCYSARQQRKCTTLHEHDSYLMRECVKESGRKRVGEREWEKESGRKRVGWGVKDRLMHCFFPARLQRKCTTLHEISEYLIAALGRSSTPKVCRRVALLVCLIYPNVFRPVCRRLSSLLCRVCFLVSQKSAHC